MNYWSIVIFIHIFAVIIGKIVDKGSYIIGFIVGCVLMNCAKNMNCTKNKV